MDGGRRCIAELEASSTFSEMMKPHEPKHYSKNGSESFMKFRDHQFGSKPPNTKNDVKEGTLGKETLLTNCRFKSSMKCAFSDLPPL